MSSKAADGGGAPEVPPQTAKPAVPGEPAAPAAWDRYEDDKYFEEYGKTAIHCAMLHDAIRTGIYHKAILGNPQDFKDKVVLDVGCGTAILSMFAARAGARKVYAVEASHMWEHAQLAVYSNGLQDVVEVIHGKMEAIEIPEMVDVIVSEWMGSFLLFESMLETVLYARDRYLKPGGKLYPARGNIYMAPLSYDKYWAKKTDFLDEVYGINMSALAPIIRQEQSANCIRGKKLKSQYVNGPSVLLGSFDISTVRLIDLERIVKAFDIPAERDGPLSGFVLWFDVTFDGATEADSLVLSSSPFCPDTHWHQDVFLLTESVLVEKGDSIRGVARLLQNMDWRRHYNLELSFQAHGRKVYKFIMS